jgi:hypothetical protein
MNNQQLQAAIDSLHQFAGNKEAWTSGKELALIQLRKLYEIQAFRASLMTIKKDQKNENSSMAKS